MKQNAKSDYIVSKSEGDNSFGIKSGFESLDVLTGGFANGDLIIIGARPAMGKTALACSLIDNVCMNGGNKCVLLTTKNSAQQTIER